MTPVISKNTIFWSIVVLFFVVLCLAYSNHFDNVFHFDDAHTIVGNQYIRDISNLPLFFTDVKYYGTMPTNRGYNPILVSLNAIDYWLAGGLDVRYFHTSIFISYLFLLFLLYLLIRNIFNISYEGMPDRLKFFALLAVGYFGLHAANAETINYIIMRSDSFSTLCIIAALLFFQNKKFRKYQLHILAMLVAIGTKATGVMFGPILFIYAFLFEQDGNFLNLIKKSEWNRLYKAFMQAMPAILIGFVAFYISRTQFVSKESVMFAEGDVYQIYKYFITQWVVMVHYLGNFILPLDLSGDPDFTLYYSIINRKILLSLGLLLALFIAGLIASTKKKYRPVTFGIFWFFLALAPTSSFHPMGQVSNDHRTFFPYIGLIISLFWLLYLLYERYKVQLNSFPMLKRSIISLVVIIYALQAYGTYQRNEIWQSQESLWYDVTIKSPNNGRGQMNYALTLMNKGKYEETLVYFERAMQLMPTYSYLHINMGVLKNAMGFPKEAEIYYTNAIQYDRSNIEAYYYYAKFLLSQKRYEEALAYAKKGLDLSPGHAALNTFYTSLQQMRLNSLENLESTKTLSENDYINLSLTLFNEAKYEECISACYKALEINPNSKEAYNNVGIASIRLGKIDQAILACNKALEIDPNFVLAKNNLNWAKSLKSN